MGGTRCVFRDCKVSSQRNPKMHFFKFPVKNPQRLKIWLKNCSNEELSDLANLKKLANRAVCARHFRLECFMNYKMDRLIASQMPKPTLIRINKYLAWDVESLDENGKAMMIKLKKPTAKHLIPPPGFECPLGMDVIDDKQEEMPPSELEASEVLKIDLTRPKRKMKPSNNQHNKAATKRLNTLELTLGDSRPSSKSVEDEITTDVESTKTSIAMTEHEKLKVKYDKLLSDHNQLKKTKALEMQMRSSPCVFKSETKFQLYQGLTKYLGPTMAALVRMEMFGGSEDRDWQNDERQFAMELLQLGEAVYTYCSEEWRFRLPSLRLVRSWLNNQSEDDILLL